MAFGGRKEVPVEIIFDQERFDQIKDQVGTLLGEISSAVEELEKARKALKKEREALTREVDKFRAAQRKVR